MQIYINSKKSKVPPAPQYPPPKVPPLIFFHNHLTTKPSNPQPLHFLSLLSTKSAEMPT